MYLFLPVVFIAAAIAYSMLQSKKIARAVADGRGGELLHNAYAGYFDKLEPGEKIVYAWTGTTYEGALLPEYSIGVGERVFRLLKQTLYSFGGVRLTYYAPTVQIVATSKRRILVAEEYTSGNERGHFRAHSVWRGGTRVLTAAEAFPGKSENKDRLLQFGLAAILKPEQLVLLQSREQSLLVWMGDDKSMTYFNALRSHADQLAPVYRVPDAVAQAS